MSQQAEARLSVWMREHLAVALFPFEDPNPLANLEARVLQKLDPPLNLDGRARTQLRVELSRLRAELANAPTA